MYFLVAEVTEVIAVESRRPRKQFRDTENLVERSFGRRQAAFGFRQKDPFSINHFHTETTGVGMFIHELNDLFKGVFFHHGIRIQQQHIFTFGHAHGLIVCL